MSRIGRQPIAIPEGVSASLEKEGIMVRGPKGELILPIFAELKVEIKNEEILVNRTKDDKQSRALHGLLRSLIANCIQGVSSGYEKRLELEGTGYRVKKEENKLVLTLGFSHPVVVEPPEGIELNVEGNKEIIIRGIDKQRVGQTAANIRSLKKPEPYKGKGIRYKGEIVRRKPGKAAKVGAAQAE